MSNTKHNTDEEKKRKPTDDEYESSDSYLKSQDADNPFKKSRRVGRSPPKAEAKIDELLGCMKTLMNDVKQIKEDQQHYMREVEELKTVNRKQEEKIKQMEGKIERLERNEKKNNLVIKGIKDIDKNPEQSIREVLNKIGVANVEVEKTTLIKPKKSSAFVIAKMKRWEDKISILKAKRNLKGTEIYIQCDYTEEELRIQKRLRDIAKEQRENGKVCKVGYGRVIIDREEWKWNSITEKIERGVYRDVNDAPKN